MVPGRQLTYKIGMKPMASDAVPERVLSQAQTGRDKLIFLVTDDWYFWLHRLPMARAAQEAGFAVAVATRVAAHGERIEGAGFTLHPLGWRRGALGPVANFAALVEIWRLYRRERPLVVHHVSLKPALLGGLAALGAGVPAIVNVITGMGYGATSPTLKGRLIGRMTRLAAPALLLRTNARTIVENEDDRAALIALRPGAAARIAKFSGTGVDLTRFHATPEPTPPIVAAYAGRMIASKGLSFLVEAQQSLQRQGIDLRLHLAGAPDPENPTSLPEATLAAWNRLPGVRWLGHQADIRTVWEHAHIAVLASEKREGLPVSLLEAAAMGRPIVATDIPGTREFARDNVNALLTPPENSTALAEALARLARDGALRARLGAAGREMVEKSFSDRAATAATASLYRALLQDIGVRRPA
jgi:glycosyltransferase involved in cell wall biosynthesis